MRTTNVKAHRKVSPRGKPFGVRQHSRRLTPAQRAYIQRIQTLSPRTSDESIIHGQTTVPSSELAMHVGIDGQEIAAWEANPSGGATVWTKEELQKKPHSMGTLGLDSEVLPVYDKGLTGARSDPFLKELERPGFGAYQQHMGAAEGYRQLITQLPSTRAEREPELKRHEMQAAEARRKGGW